MTNQITRQLHEGWIEKLECDRIAKVKHRAMLFGARYYAAKRVFAAFTAEYQPNGWVRLYAKRGDLCNVCDLKTFIQTGHYSHQHFTRHIGIYMPIHGIEEAYLEMNLPMLVKASGSFSGENT